MGHLLIRSLVRSLAQSLLSSWDSEIFLSTFQGVLNHSGASERVSNPKVLSSSLNCSISDVFIILWNELDQAMEAERKQRGSRNGGKKGGLKGRQDGMEKREEKMIGLWNRKSINYPSIESL